MSEYIKREDTIDAIAEAQRVTSNDEFGSSKETEWEIAGLALAKAVVNEVPSADVEEVVHCKDCQYAYFDRPHPICGYINDAYMLVKEGYCSYGERKEQEEC